MKRPPNLAFNQQQHTSTLSIDLPPSAASYSSFTNFHLAAMDYSGYANQQQQHAYDYDPSSQIQPYDQSYAYQQYYAYNHQYAYYAHTVPDTHQPQFQYQPEPAPVHPPGVNPPAPEPAPPRATHLPTGPSQYRGRGGRGGRPFRGGGRGWGRRLSGGRHFPSHSSGPAISNVADAPAAGDTLVVQPSSSISGQTSPKPAQVPAAPSQPPPSRKVLCEICKVECNTPEVLEQHKNGKRHKKNMKVHEELQRHKAINGQESRLIPSSQSNLTDQPKQLEESEKKGCPTEIIGTEVIADNHKDEKEQQNNTGETSEVPAEDLAGKTTDNSAVRVRGLKRKMRGGRGCKYTRTNDGLRRPVEPPRIQQAPSFICEICNVKCESEIVYRSHLTGKKHLTSLKRAHDKHALSGVGGLQTHYPPDISALANAINAQVQQGDSDPQVLLAHLLMTLLSQAQQPAIAPPPSTVAAQIPASTSVAGSSNEPQLSQKQESEITEHVDMENLIKETKNQLPSVPLQSHNAPAGSVNALSTLINAQIQQGVSDPQVLLAQLLITVLSQAQVPAIAPPSGFGAAQIPAPTSVAGSSYEPQLSQTQVSEIPGQARIENPTGETKNQLLSVPPEGRLNN